MIILAIYISHQAKPEWIAKFIHHLEGIRLIELDIIPIVLPSSALSEFGTKIECIYPRFSFEFEEKEAESLAEIITKLDERLRMEIDAG